MTRDELYEKAKLLPLTPGVYIMHSSSGKVIYVGKSKALKNRVSSYFMATAKHNAKTRKMVSSVNDFEVYHTKTEMEALILENQFIKQFLPRYNIKLKDDSDYPYIELTADDYPRLSVVYKRKNSKNHYFGPYSSASVAYEIVKATKKAFKLPTCKKVFPDEIGKGRPCLDFHLGQCFAPCIKENAAKSDFWAAYSAAEKFLKGDFNSLLKELSTNMEKASEALEFEHAAKLRDTIQSVKKLGEKQHIVAPLGTIADVVGIYYDDLGSAVSVLFIRNGAISDRENFFFSADEIINSGNITSFLYRFYLAREFIPKEIYIDFDLIPEDRAALYEKFFETGKVTITRPQKGDKKKLLDQATNNAQNLLMHKRQAENKTVKFLAGIAEFLHLDVLPQRIEAYDISNSGDEHITCGMAVMIDAHFAKRKYRSFNIREKTQNDYAAMREAIDRRLKHVDGDWLYPDLILLDGGANHVSVIKQLLDERKIILPVFGMIKDEHHKTRTLTDGENEISLTARDDLFRFFYKIQEEVHNISFEKMDAKRRKSVKSTSLTDIDGVGQKTAELLLKYFGGLKKIKNASLEELIAIDGISRKTAENIYLFYKK